MNGQAAAGHASASRVDLRMQGWNVPQTRRYWALHVPHARVWIFGLDDQVALDQKVGIDSMQLRYFLHHIEELRAANQSAKVILVQHSPWFILDTPVHFTLRHLLQELVRYDLLRLIITGDMHYYARYSPIAGSGSQPNPAQVTLLVSGGGGAFLHPTRHTPPRVSLPILGGSFSFHSSFPSKSDLRPYLPWWSWRVEWGASWTFCCMLIVLIICFTHYKLSGLLSLVFITAAWIFKDIHAGFQPFWWSVMPIVCVFLLDFLPIFMLSLLWFVQMAARAAKQPNFGIEQAILDAVDNNRSHVELPTFDQNSPYLAHFPAGEVRGFLAAQFSAFTRVRFNLAVTQLSWKETMGQWSFCLQLVFDNLSVSREDLVKSLRASPRLFIHRQVAFWFRVLSWPKVMLMDVVWRQSYLFWWEHVRSAHLVSFRSILPPADRHSITRMFFRICRLIVGSYAVYILSQALLIPLALIVLTTAGEVARPWGPMVSGWLPHCLDGIFAFTGIADYKNFLRLSLSDSSITIYPVFVTHVPVSFADYWLQSDAANQMRYLTARNLTQMYEVQEPIRISW